MPDMHMYDSLSLPGIVANSLNQNYTADHAVADLEKLMNEATLIEFEHGTDSSQYIDMQQLIHIQEKLVQAKLDGNLIFDRLGGLTATLHEDK